MITAEHEEKEMKAVHERDLDNLLVQLALKNRFEVGKIRCKFCKSVVTRDNLYSLIHESGATNFVCYKPSCISEFMLYREEKKKDLKS